MRSGLPPVCTLICGLSWSNVVGTPSAVQFAACRRISCSRIGVARIVETAVEARAGVEQLADVRRAEAFGVIRAERQVVRTRASTMPPLKTSSRPMSVVVRRAHGCRELEVMTAGRFGEQRRAQLEIELRSPSISPGRRRSRHVRRLARLRDRVRRELAASPCDIRNPTAYANGPAGRSNSSPDKLSATSLSSCSLLSFCVNVAEASISGVMLPAPPGPCPPKMLNGTQPGAAAHAAGSTERQRQLARVEDVDDPCCEALLRPQFRLTSQYMRALAELQLAVERARHIHVSTF